MDDAALLASQGLSCIDERFSRTSERFSHMSEGLGRMARLLHRTAGQLFYMEKGFRHAGEGLRRMENVCDVRMRA